MKTREPQYGNIFRTLESHETSHLGIMANYTWNHDPKRIVFTLARYKFVAKMLSGRKKVLEVGCGDAFGTRIVQQMVGKVTAIDFDPVFISDIKERMDPDWALECFVHDVTEQAVPGVYDAAYSLDVLEHIEPVKEDSFMTNILSALDPNGVLIIGTPSLESQSYATQGSRDGHINCKSGSDLMTFLERWFHNVFVFSMNDETLHTGFYPMAHYLLAVCATRRTLCI